MALDNINDVGWIAAIFTFLTGLFSKEHVWKFLNGITGRGFREQIRVIEAREAKRALITERFFSSMNNLKILLKNIVAHDDPNYALVQEFIESLPTEEELKSITDVNYIISEDQEDNSGSQ